MKDTSKISNAEHEIRTAAKACNVYPIAIRLAKYATGSNDRETIYNWVKERKGFTYNIVI